MAPIIVAASRPCPLTVLRTPRRPSESRRNLSPLRAQAEEHSAASLQHALKELVESRDIGSKGAKEALADVLVGANEMQTAAFLAMLHQKGENPSELAGLAMAMREQGVQVEAEQVVDIVGTGGDGADTVNISTGASLLAASAGARVAKHGNRSVSSKSGSADVLEQMGVAIDLGPEGVTRCVEEAGMGFMLAPRYHPAMSAVRPVRKSLGIRTAFNLLGPCLNPACARRGVIGVYSEKLLHLMADALAQLGVERALVVNSQGLDELSPTAPATIVELSPSGTEEYQLDPRGVGVEPCELEELQGSGPEESCRMLTDAISGERGPVAEALILNAGAALAVHGVASGVKEGVAMARDAHEKGLGEHAISRLVNTSKEAKCIEDNR